MPSGLTYKVSEKDNFPLEDYIWICAKHIGHLSHMRESDPNAPIVMPVKDTHYKIYLEESKARLVAFESMNLDEAQYHMDAEREDLNKDYLKTIEEQKVYLNRYQIMLDKAKNWTPPSPEHEELKSMMILQLENSIKFDCDISYYTQKINEPPITAKQWLDLKLKAIRNTVQYYERQVVTREDNYAASVKWITQLIESVPLPK